MRTPVGRGDDSPATDAFPLLLTFVRFVVQPRLALLLRLDLALGSNWPRAYARVTLSGRTVHRSAGLPRLLLQLRMVSPDEACLDLARVNPPPS